MSLGLCNTPTTFQSTMNTLLQPFLKNFVIVFFDDILVYSKSSLEHTTHLELVFECLLHNHFFLSCLSALLHNLQLSILVILFQSRVLVLIQQRWKQCLLGLLLLTLSNLEDSWGSRDSTSNSLSTTHLLLPHSRNC